MNKVYDDPELQKTHEMNLRLKKMREDPSSDLNRILKPLMESMDRSGKGKKINFSREHDIMTKLRSYRDEKEMGFMDKICEGLLKVQDGLGCNTPTPIYPKICDYINMGVEMLGCDGSQPPAPSCTTSLDCPSDQYCLGGECVPKKVDGSSCTSSEECIGFCDLDINQCASF